MTFNLGIAFAERRFCFIAILISTFTATLRAQSASMQQGSFNQERSSLCRLRIPDTIPQSTVNAKEAMTDGVLAYTPVSARCKFSLFLGSTDSPYTFASAGFEATLAQATGQWPHYGGGMQGWGKRFGATLANTESRRLIQTFALSTILHQDPRYFSSHKRTLISRVWGTSSINFFVRSTLRRGW
jgi:hypothetical protein